MSAIKDRSLSTATSLFSKPFTKAEALAALREPRFVKPSFSAMS